MICKKCGSEFPVWIFVDCVRKNLSKRKYCLVCSPFGKHNTKQLHKEKEVNAYCLLCGNPRSEESSRRNRGQYCSNKCYQEHKYKLYIERWLQGKETGNKKSDGSLRAYVRRYVLEQAQNCCSRCGWNDVNPYSGKVPLTINHIDGNPFNSCVANLEVLCPNCHSLTEHYGILNKGNGRKFRWKGLTGKTLERGR